MAKRRRYKRASKEELKVVLERNWVQVSLGGSAIPSWLKGISEEKLIAVYASGSSWYPQNIELHGSVIGNVVAGYDVFRYDIKDEKLGTPVNKDHYIVIRDPTSDEWFLVIGPEKIVGDHRFAESPKKHPELEIIEIPRYDEDK